MRRLHVMLAAVVLAACGDQTAPVATADGLWDGVSGRSEIHLALRQSGADVTGVGAVIVNGNTYYLVDSLSGSFTPPTVALRLHSRLGELTLTSHDAGAGVMTAVVSGQYFGASPLELVLSRR